MLEYLDGNQFFSAFRAGSKALFRKTDHLNKINIFPIADGDTGTNLSITLKSIIENTKPTASIKDTLSSIADSAFVNAQGNSGIIFAQYLLGLNQEMKQVQIIGAKEFALLAQQAVKYVYYALLNPVEGTIITVIKDWAYALGHHSEKTNDFKHLFPQSLGDAQASLLKTPAQLQVLADAGVVDAGAQGFVHFLEGICEHIKNGCNPIDSTKEKPEDNIDIDDLKSPHYVTEYPKYRYCTECVLTNYENSIDELKERYRSFGDSFILAGNNQKLHLHIHSNNPDVLLYQLHQEGEVSQVKADDMLSQYNIVNHKKHAVGLMTDSAADLPMDLILKHQIMMIPFGISFGASLFLDKYTIQPESFYELLKQEKHAPKSSVPALKVIDSVMSFMESQYSETICLNVAAVLSSVFQTGSNLATKHKGIKVIDSKQLSVTQGLLLLRIAGAIEAGMPYRDINTQVSTWSKKTFIYTDIATLKYMIRSGRVSNAKGLLASLFNIKPIVSVDANGKGYAYGKSFSRKANMQKIINIISTLHKENEIWEYAIVHSDALDRANCYAEKLTDIIGKAPAYIMPLSPVVGVHNGIGAVAIGVSLK